MRAEVFQGRVGEQMWYGFRGMQYPALLRRLRPGWTVTVPYLCLNRDNTGENRRLMVFNGPGAGTTILRFIERPIPESLVRDLKQCFVERRHGNEEQELVPEDGEGSAESLPGRESDQGQGIGGQHREASKGEGQHQAQPLVAFLKSKVNKNRRRSKR